jgi:serine protease Do
MSARQRLVLLLLATLLPQGAAGAERRTPVVRAVEATRDAVVNISAEEVVMVRQDPFFDQFFSDFFELQPRRRAYTRKSLGSGVIIRTDGYVVTNAHVVARGDRIRVVLANERELDATLIGTDENADLAVLKIEAEGLPALDFKTAADTMIGETVIAIGNPFGFSHTVTTGVISATGRSLRTDERTYLDFIQIDASINPGNSGGPLLNIEGELIGINTAIYGRAQNIGFAIPAARASQIVDHLIRFGEVKHGYIGLRVQSLTTQLAEALEVPHQKGVVVHNIDKGSPAARAGIVSGDIIVAVNDHAPRNEHEFEERLALIPEGTSFTLSLLRETGTTSVPMVAAPLTDAILDEIGWRRLGLATGQRLPGGGVTIAKVRENSYAARAGLRANDILFAIEEHSINSEEEFRAAIADLRRDDQARVAVRRGRAAYRLSLRLED